MLRETSPFRGFSCTSAAEQEKTAEIAKDAENIIFAISAFSPVFSGSPARIRRDETRYDPGPAGCGRSDMSPGGCTNPCWHNVRRDRRARRQLRQGGVQTLAAE